MNVIRIPLSFVLHTILCLTLLAGCSNLNQPDPGSTFSFAVVSDVHPNNSKNWNSEKSWNSTLVEIRTMNVNPEPKFNPAEFIIGIGDIAPTEVLFRGYASVFEGDLHMKAFLPVMGNHDISDRENMITLVSTSNATSLRDDTSVNYFFDWKNVRLIVVDGYSDLGSDGVINSQGREWVEQVIESASPEIDHIFVAFHEPAFPRHKHLVDSFNASPAERDAFWNMLVAHKDKVRAVFVGHTHAYSRMRVLDPTSAVANDLISLPDEAGGIYQVNVGCVNTIGTTTVVQVQIEGKKVTFRTLEAHLWQDDHFNLIDEWHIP